MNFGTFSAIKCNSVKRNSVSQKVPALVVFMVLFCLCFGFPIGALDWPAQEGVLSSNFGYNDNGRPVSGISFETEENARATGMGEIIFRSGGINNPSRLPSPLGAWAALDHGDGIISVYSRLDEASQIRIPERLVSGTPLGASGISGWSNTKGFYFFLFDRKERRWINPSMLIDPRPDTRAPVILSVRLENEQGIVIDPAQTRTLSQGRYTISVSAADTMLRAGEPPLAPFRIVCSVNGIESGVLNFETYSARDGVLMVYRNGLVPVKEVFSPHPAWEAGEIHFNRGQAILEVIVSDYSGNSRNALYRLQIE